MSTEAKKVVKTIEDVLVKSGDEIPRKTVVKNDHTVYVERVSKHDSTNQNYRIYWTFDFSNVSQEELLQMATDSAVIAYRKRGFRKVPDSQITDACVQTIDVKSQIIDTERKGLPDDQKLKALLGKMSKEEVEAILKEAGLA